MDWVTQESMTMLSRGYLLDGESVEDAILRIAKAASKILGRPDLTDKFFRAISNGYLVPSSPIWANLGTERGLPISCFGSYVEDSLHGIYDTLAEVASMTKYGGGTSGFFGELRPRGSTISKGGKSSGAISFMRLFDTSIQIVSQAGIRRGSFAAYLPIDHPDIKEFLKIKSIGSPVQELHFGVCVSDEWLWDMINGKEENREIWLEVLRSRQEKGEPYIFFTDNANGEYCPEIYRGQIKASNLCTEIMLPSSKDESFVCCLSSLNLEKFYDWADTDLVEVTVYFLNAVMDDFIAKTEHMPNMQKAHNFAKNHRAIGIGTLGWHSLLLSGGIPFDCLTSKMLNSVIFKTIQEQAYQASHRLYKESGPPEGFPELRRRNTTLLSIAPNVSSSSIAGQVSPGVEPYESVYYTAHLAKGNFTRRNKHFSSLLDKYKKNTAAVWNSILQHNGSVQHLDFLTPDEKQLFLSYSEINPYAIIHQAIDRQKYLDQGQSINIKISNKVPIKDVNKLILTAWGWDGDKCKGPGVKALYYQKSNSIAKEFSGYTCVGCAN